MCVCVCMYFICVDLQTILNYKQVMQYVESIFKKQ